LKDQYTVVYVPILHYLKQHKLVPILFKPRFLLFVLSVTNT